MPVGRKPIPTHLKLLRGNPGCRPINKNEPEPAVEPEIPAAPDYLRGYAVDEWCLVAAELHRMRLLTRVDVASLASYCVAYGQWRTALEALDRMAKNDPVMGGLLVKQRSGDAAENPLVRIARKASIDMLRIASEFGFTPAARSRINAGISGFGSPPNKFEGLLAGVPA